MHKNHNVKFFNWLSSEFYLNFFIRIYEKQKYVTQTISEIAAFNVEISRTIITCGSDFSMLD